MYCPSCGADLAEGIIACDKCKKPLPKYMLKEYINSSVNSIPEEGRVSNEFLGNTLEEEFIQTSGPYPMEDLSSRLKNVLDSEIKKDSFWKPFLLTSIGIGLPGFLFWIPLILRGLLKNLTIGDVAILGLALSFLAIPATLIVFIIAIICLFIRRKRNAMGLIAGGTIGCFTSLSALYIFGAYS